MYIVYEIFVKLSTKKGGHHPPEHYPVQLDLHIQFRIGQEAGQHNFLYLRKI